MGCPVGLLAVGLLRLPIRRRVRRMAVRGRGLAWPPVGLLRALAVWGGHTCSLDSLQMLGPTIAATIALGRQL